jgi:hypothetical protein
MNFWETNNTNDDSETEYKYKILVWPNITYYDDLEKDSYIIVLHNIIRVLNSLRNDIHWTIVTPKEVGLIKFPNTEQIIYDFPSYPNAMRTHFDNFKVYNVLKGMVNDFDIVYSHCPEHTLQLSNLIYNQTNIRPLIIGYCHWYELNENTDYSKTMFLANICGTLEMDECGVNSLWLKELVLKKAKSVMSENVLEKLDKIIQPHYLGTDMDDFEPFSYKRKSILFNHRANGYTGWNRFLRLMDSLWEKRQDFKVYVTLANEENRPYIKKVNFASRKEYSNFIKTMHVGVGMFETYSAWSLSTTDGLSRGVPYLLPNKLCYPEMVEDDYPLLYESDEDFLEKLEDALDNDRFKLKFEARSISICNRLQWEKSVPQWFNNWKIFDKIKCATKTEAYYRIYNYIKSKGFVTKKDIIDHMGWGRSIGFSSYRNTLRLEPNIKLYKNGYKFTYE